jgi:hypothetical protein
VGVAAELRVVGQQLEGGPGQAGDLGPAAGQVAAWLSIREAATRLPQRVVVVLAGGG